LDDAELLKDLEKNIERAKLKPDFHIWDQPIATLGAYLLSSDTYRWFIDNL
jgi:hypothetical protein